MIVNIYDEIGNKCDEIEINDDLTYVNGRVYKGKQHYYKGIGLSYDFHFSLLKNKLDIPKYIILEKSDIFYLGYKVRKKSFTNKIGIFQEQYQPHFSDFIGSCGVKELSIIENETFPYSSMKLIKSVCIDKKNKQYYFIVDYSCKRKKFSDQSNLIKLKELLDYMISENWNFIWDKNSIEDITENCLISDIGDIFQSSNLSHKLGSVYSLLYSLCKKDLITYLKFIYLYDLDHKSSIDIVFNAIEILKKNNVNTDIFFLDTTKIESYKNIVINHLITGKNCGDCDILGFGDIVRTEYLNRTKAQLNI